jgi:hypothetical protein
MPGGDLAAVPAAEDLLDGDRRQRVEEGFGAIRVHTGLQFGDQAHRATAVAAGTAGDRSVRGAGQPVGKVPSRSVTTSPRR